ncbi:MAG TPA: sugar phosphate isomerase/epimerase [Roseiarcus sp.]|nr:sugar phosphate isomerase/epimerase [Roseiarcus sp.]
MKLGYNTWSMPTLSFEDAVTHCARLGFDSVEVTVSDGWRTDVMTLAPGAAAEWKRIANDAGITLTSLTANAPILVEGPAWDAARDRLTRSLALAAELQAPGQRMPISLTASFPSVLGAPPQDLSDEMWRNERGRVVARFGELASIARRLGARVALEPHVWTLVCNAERALQVLDEVASDALGLNLDISHFAVQGLPIAENVRTLAPRAIGCEVKDQRGVKPHFEFLIPGEGDFDYVAFLREMVAAGYDGSVSVEISVLRQRLDGYDPYEAARQSYVTLAKAFELAGVVRPKADASRRMER